MKSEALDDKMAETLTEVKVDTLVTLLSEIKAEALMDTLAARVTDVKIDTLGETVAQRYAEALISKLAHGVRRVDVKTVNETVQAQALVDTGRQTSTHRDRRTWQNTRKFGGFRSIRHTGRQTSRGGGSDT